MSDVQTAYTENAINAAYQNIIMKLFDNFLNAEISGDNAGSSHFLNGLQIAQKCRDECIQVSKQNQSP